MSTSLIIARSETVRVATTACATSSAPRARSGAGRTRSRLSMNGVDTEPGQMATTRRPRLRTSSIRLLEKPSTACFDAQYAVPPSTPYCASKHAVLRSEEHTSELQSLTNLVCRLLLEKKNYKHKHT